MTRRWREEHGTPTRPEAQRPAPSVRVRPALTADVPALSALARRTWSDAFGESTAPENERAELESGRSERYFARALLEETILVADDGRGLVGYGQFGDVTIPEAEARPGDQQLHRLYVDTVVQGRGLGRALMGACLRHPRLDEAPRIYLQVWEQNPRAVRLYESFGFERVGATTFTIGSEVMQDMVMLLDKGGAAISTP